MARPLREELICGFPYQEASSNAIKHFYRNEQINCLPKTDIGPKYIANPAILVANPAILDASQISMKIKIEIQVVYILYTNIDTSTYISYTDITLLIVHVLSMYS